MVFQSMIFFCCSLFSNAEYLFPAAHWDEKFHHKMVDNRGFMVTRSYTVGVPMMHRTGKLQTCPMPQDQLKLACCCSVFH